MNQETEDHKGEDETCSSPKSTGSTGTGTSRSPRFCSLIWFLVTFVMGYFAIPLAEINFFGWPLSFYMAAQGSLIIYVAILYYYAKKMRRLDVEYGVDEGDL